MTSATPREVIERYLAITARGPDPEMAELLAEEVVIELPFLPPGVPRTQVGREPFRRHLEEGAAIQRFDSVQEVRVHETADPEVVIAEYRLHGAVLPGGRRFAFAIVMVARVRDGLIVSIRSYSDPLDRAIAFGGAEELLAGLAAS